MVDLKKRHLHLVAIADCQHHFFLANSCMRMYLKPISMEYLGKFEISDREIMTWRTGLSKYQTSNLSSSQLCLSQALCKPTKMML